MLVIASLITYDVQYSTFHDANRPLPMDNTKCLIESENVIISSLSLLSLCVLRFDFSVLICKSRVNISVKTIFIIFYRCVKGQLLYQTLKLSKTKDGHTQHTRTWYVVLDNRYYK